MNSPGPWVTMSARRSDASCWVISTLPARMMVRPSPTMPTRASASPALYQRTSPNRRMRSISEASSVGNTWARRVSMIDGVDTAMVGPNLSRVLACEAYRRRPGIVAQSASAERAGKAPSALPGGPRCRHAPVHGNGSTTKNPAHGAGLFRRDTESRYPTALNHACSMMHEYGQQDNDRERNPEQP